MLHSKIHANTAQRTQSHEMKKYRKNTDSPAGNRGLGLISFILVVAVISFLHLLDELMKRGEKTEKKSRMHQCLTTEMKEEGTEKVFVCQNH